MGTASTMQCMAEALGLALPGSALVPATMSEVQFLQKSRAHDYGARQTKYPSNRHSDAAGPPRCIYHTQRDRFDQRPDPSAGNEGLGMELDRAV